MKRTTVAIFVLITSFLLPMTASADFVSVWVAGKAAHLNGKGQVYDKLDNQFAGGVEAGLELMGIDLPMVEAYILGPDQYMFTANIGFDVGFGDDLRVTAGLYTGLVFFILPEQEKSEPVPQLPAEAFLPEADQNNESARMQAAEQADSFTLAYNETVAAEEAELSKYSLGLNLVRARLQIDYRILPALFLGIEGAFGYHYMLTGEDAIADVKKRAIEREVEKYRLSDEQKKLIEDTIGAKELETDDMNGTNYNVGVYLKLDL